MKSIKQFSALATMLTMMTALFLPVASQAQVEPVDPNSEAIHKFLDEINVEVSPTDRLWDDQAYRQFMHLYLGLIEKNNDLLDLMEEMTMDIAEMLKVGNEIEDERYRDDFETPQDFVDEFDNEILPVFESIDRTSFDFFNFFFMIGFMGESAFDDLMNLDYEDDYYDDYYDDDWYDYESPDIWVDAWAEPWEPVDAGKIVYLHADVLDWNTDAELHGYEYNWTQTYGPDVLWLNAEGEGDTAFIVPQYDVLGDETYLEFEVEVMKNGQSETQYVWVDLIMG